MKDDAAKLLIIILGISILIGLLVLGGYFIFTGEAYSVKNIFISNKESGFYPYVPPLKSPDEVL